MKKLFYSVVLSLTIFSLPVAAQDAAENIRLSQILQLYYNIKDALVAGNGKGASDGATAFIKNLNGLSYRLISEGNAKTLLKDAGTIADAKSIDKQRAVFSNFSNNMTEVARQLKLSKDPVYLQYCPMKKASWLSSEKNIKNPYYGSGMLTCGKVTETIQ